MPTATLLLKKWAKKNWLNIITLLLSLIAIFVSYFSYQVSKQSFDYEVGKDALENTPAINETVDSFSIYFKLNDSNSDLQLLQITFPQKFVSEEIVLNTKPIVLSKFRLESLVKQYLLKTVQLKDSSVKVGEFGIPVLLNYSAIVYGEPFSLRENRIFFFSISLTTEFQEVKFLNSFLLQRCGYPIKKQFHWKRPWATLSEDKIAEQDKKDVEEFLNNQFQESIKYLE